jgi:hypothetical protein
MRCVAAVVAGLFVILLMVGCGSGSGQGADISGKTEDEGQPAAETATAGRWRVRLTVKPSQLGPIGFAAKNLARTKRTNSHPWIEHDLVFRNTGNRPVTFDDTRSSTFLGEAGHERLLAADEGCGYALNYPGAPAKAGACRAYLDVVAVKPHASAKRPIRLAWGLPGMDPLVAGTYVFQRPVRFQLGTRPPGTGEGRSGVVRLVYEIRGGPSSPRLQPSPLLTHGWRTPRPL